jgi:hypothetical protein
MLSIIPVIVAIAFFDFYARPKSAGAVITKNVIRFPMKRPKKNIYNCQIN